LFPFFYHYTIASVGVQTGLGGTILHFSVELGPHAVGGVGTCLNELRRASGPGTGFVHLSSYSRSENDENVVSAGFYDMDVLNRLEFDVAVFHYYGLAYLADDSFLRGRPLVYVVHSVPTTEPWSLLDPYGGNDDVGRGFERLCDAARLIVCVSEAERGKLLLLYPDLQPKTTVIPNGFSAFGDDPLRVGEERRVYGFLGRADERKGLRELLRAFAESDGSLRIACGEEDADYARAVRDDVERLGLDGRVTWIGRVAEPDKAAFLRSLDALVVPSRWEPFGYVALEALRAGIPPLISRQGGLTEIVGREYPYMFDPSSTESIAACLREFRRDDADDVRRAVEQARRHAAGLSAGAMAAAYERLRRDPRVASPRAMPPRGRRYAGAGGLLPPAFGDASATPKQVRRPFPKS